MSSPTIVHTLVEMARAWFRYDGTTGGNELFLDSKPDRNDPVGIRRGTFDKGVAFGKDSWDLLDGDPERPRRLEKVVMIGGPDGDSDVAQWIEQGMPGGILNIRCQRPGTDDDKNMVSVLYATSRYLEFFGHKLCRFGANGEFEWLLGTTAAPRELLRSVNGQYELELQNDGNFVIYDEHNGHAPIFSAKRVLERLKALDGKDW